MPVSHALRSFVAVDTETTGLDFENDRLIELAAVRFEDGRPVADFEALVAPGKPLSAVSRLITGLTAEELEAAPPAGDTLRAFLTFVGDLPLVAHNAEFDAHFVRRALEAESLGAVPGAWIDSLLMSRIAWPDWDSHRLDSLAERLNVPRDAEHRALPDARRAGFVFIAAQDFIRDQLSAKARADLARLSRELPDWSLVFTEGADEKLEGEAAGAAQDEGSKLPVNSPGATSTVAKPGLSPADADAAEEALFSEGWLALETPPDVDDAHAAFAAAAAAAAQGQRVLVSLPDAYAWNALRKSAQVTHVAHVPQTTVRVEALTEPSGMLCADRLSLLTEDPARLMPEERAALMPLVAWADLRSLRSLRVAGSSAVRPALLADGRGFSPERNRLTALRVSCDAFADDPDAQAARARAATAGVILVTHATLCAHLRGEGTLLPACDSLIVSGAHRLPEAAQRAFGAEVSLFRLRHALQLFRFSPEADAGIWQDIAPLLSNEDRETWKTAWFDPEERFQKFLQKAGRQAAKKRPAGDFRVRYAGSFEAAFGVETGPVSEALRANEVFLERNLEVVGGVPAQDLRRVLARLRAFRHDFEILTAAEDEALVFSFEDVSNPHKAVLRSTPLEMRPFGARLREFFGAGLFVSPALLTPEGSSFEKALGLDDAADTGDGGRLRTRRATSADSHLRAPARVPRFLMTPFAPGFSATESPETFARFLAETAGPFAEGGVLVFFPSQGALRTVYQALKAVLPEGTICYGQHVDGNRDAVKRLFASTRGGWVFATEGIAGLKDSEGKGPDLVLVTRMPLPPAHDPVLEARGEILRAEGRNARAELWNPAAILRLKKEWAALAGGPAAAPRALWLLDARASGEGLGAQAARAMGCEPETVRNVAELASATQAAQKLF